MRELLASSRSHHKADLLLAAVLQALFEADRALPEIVARVQQIWPGAVQSVADVKAALELGSELRLLARAESLGSQTVWTLTKAGADDVRQHADWVGEMRARAREEVRERAKTGLMTEISVEQADALLDHLVRALAQAIRSTQAPYVGQVDALLNTGRAGGRVVPQHLDRDALLQAVGDGDDPTIVFVRGLTLAAVDPLDAFGNELVSHITTGCILHAFIAGVDRQRLIARIGSPSGQRVVLDTPLLIDLIGPQRVASSLEEAIRTAVAGGWDVVALEHSIEEAQQVLHRDVPAISKTLSGALQEGSQQAWYASLTEDQLPSLCVEVLRDGRYRNLEQFLVAADRLPELLTDLGVTVRAHGNNDAGQVARLYGALNIQLSERNHRSDLVLQRDADTMAFICRRRQRQRGSRWPGGWVVTKDRYMAPAYAEAEPRDRVSLTITAAQWTTLLAVSAEPADVERLAQAAAGQFMDDAAWTIPVRYPPEVAIELARQLSPNQGGSETDIRVAQMTLDEALDDPTGTSVASLVLAERAKRINTIAAADKLRLTEGLAAAREHAAAAQMQAQAADNKRLHSERKIQTLSSERDILTGDAAWLRDQVRRSAISAVVAIAVTALVVAGFFTAGPGTGVLLTVGLVILGFGLYRWCTQRNARLWPILVGAGVDLIGVVSGLMQIFDS